jgi:CarboxypepD_reg-like domain/TonB dependent receptor/TonB-dependent Receptor Plug Domain
MKKAVILVLLYMHVAMVARTATITGMVTDVITGEILPGATVFLESTRYLTVTDLQGHYALKNVSKGRYEVIVSYIGYERSEEISITLESGTANKIVDFRLRPKIRDLDQVFVMRNNDDTKEKSGVNLERRADIIANILSAKTISLLPDVTVANALQRVSGVSIQRTSTGEGRYAIIRGMDQRYNNTLVNGIKIPSPDDKYRFVPMDMFPSDLLERLEVIKSLTPSMEGDAIGGTMNLVMKNAPTSFFFTVNVAAGYSTLFSNRPFKAFPFKGISQKSPAELYGNDYPATYKDFPVSPFNYYNRNPVNRTMGLTLGNSIFKKKLGYLFAVSYQDFFRGSNSEYLIPGWQPQVNNQPLFTNSYVRQYSTQTERIGINNKLNFSIDDNNKLSLYNLYLIQNEFQTRFTTNTSLGITATADEALVDLLERSRWMKQTIYNSTLQGSHIISRNFRIDWSAVLSIARSALPDMAEFTYSEEVQLDNSAGQNNSTNALLQGMTRTWQHNSERDLAGYLNLSYAKKFLGIDATLKTGLMFRSKERHNYYNLYTLVPTLQDGVPQLYSTIGAAQYSFQTVDDGRGSYTTTNGSTYSAHENIPAGYIQAKLVFGHHFEITGGSRVENTQLSYATVMPTDFNARYGSIRYTDMLPSANALYRLNSRSNLRLSYFESICRQALYEITPYLIPGEFFQETGNPNLKHTRANNGDIRYELFPGGSSNEVLLGAFYKYLHDPIEYFITNGGGPGSEYIQPGNVDHAVNYGFETSITRYFGRFGIWMNYTFTQSSIRTPKLFSYYDSTLGYAQKIVNQTRPLQGQSRHIGNISFLYKDPVAGVDAQVAYTYTDERIAQVSNYYKLDLWESPYGQFDLSIEKRLFKSFFAFCKLNNLTNSAHKVYLKQPNTGFSPSLPFQDKVNNILAEKDIYRMSVLLGVKYKI